MKKVIIFFIIALLILTVLYITNDIDSTSDEEAIFYNYLLYVDKSSNSSIDIENRLKNDIKLIEDVSMQTRMIEKYLEYRLMEAAKIQNDINDNIINGEITVTELESLINNSTSTIGIDISEYGYDFFLLEDEFIILTEKYDKFVEKFEDYISPDFKEVCRIIQNSNYANTNLIHTVGSVNIYAKDESFTFEEDLYDLVENLNTLLRAKDGITQPFLQNEIENTYARYTVITLFKRSFLTNHEYSNVINSFDVTLDTDLKKLLKDYSKKFNILNPEKMDENNHFKETQEKINDLMAY